MPLDFPSSPTLGQGFGSYVWDGEKWVATGAGAAAGDPTKISRFGDTMEGHLSLPTGPVAANAVRKDYVDALSDPTKVSKSGDTMSGHLALPTGPAAANAVRKDYVDALAPAEIVAKAVRYDAAQTLTAAQQNQARSNVYATSVDAMAYNGIQVNGSFDVNQEGVVSTAAGFPADNWQLARAGTAVLAAAQTTSAGIFPGQPRFLLISVTTGQPSMAAADYAVMLHHIEGYRIARLGWGAANAQPITICFKSAHFRTGIYSGTVRNSDGTRSYPFTYTQDVSGASEFKTITIPGETTGTWLNTNGIGWRLSFAMACGTTNTAPSAGSWLNGNFFAAPGQVNGVTSTSDFFRLSGVVVLPGAQPPSEAQSPLIMRPFDQELVLCKRYFQAFPVTAGFPINVLVDSAVASIPMTTLMRAVPTISLPWTNANYNQTPSATTWAIERTGVLNASKTGTITLGPTADTQRAFVFMYGMTFSAQGTNIQSGSSLGPVMLDARL